MKAFISKFISGYSRGAFFLLFLIVCMLTLQVIDEKEFSLFQYQRNDILSGQLWRLVSGHFVHVTWLHLILNLAGLIVVWMLFKDILIQRTWWLLTLGSIVGIDVAEDQIKFFNFNLSI